MPGYLLILFGKELAKEQMNITQLKDSSGSPGWRAAGCYFVARMYSPFSCAAITCWSVVTMDWVNV